MGFFSSPELANLRRLGPTPPYPKTLTAVALARASATAVIKKSDRVGQKARVNHPASGFIKRKKTGNHRAFVISSVSSAIGIFLFSQVYLRKLTDSVHSEVLYLCIRSSKP